MRTVKNKVRLLLSIIVIVVAIALFKANINSNVLYIKTQELINRTGWFQPNDRPIGSLTLSSPSYYGSDVNNPLAPNTNYANKVEEIRYGLNTQAITDADGIQYGIVYDNTNNDSPYTEDEYPDEIFDPAHPNGKKKLRLKYASTIDTTNANAYESNIAQNSDRYTVLYRDNKITVKDKNIIPYIGGNINDVAKKWVGILVDLNVRVVGTSGYNIEDVDYTDAARWGAKSDTTFIMWLTTERGGTYTFAQADDETKTITIEVEFVQEEIGLKDVSPLDYEYLNKEAFTTEFVNNKITVKDDSITSFEKNEEEQKWIGLLVDLGVNAEIVNNDTLVIEKDLTPYGITSDTAFIIWTYKEQAGTYTFKNVEYPSDTVDLTIEFTQEKADLISTQKISIGNFDDDNDNQGIKDNINNYTVSSLENTITIVDQGVQPYQLIGEDNKKWFGILVDLGVKVQGITSEQYETAAHWGATNDTTFVMWLTQNDAGTYVYRNANYPSDTVDLTIEFEYKQTSLVTFEPISVDNATQSETNIINNYGKYDTFVDNNQVIIIDNGVIPYAGGNDLVNPQKWMGFIVDFGVNVDGVSGYNIEDIDRTAARRWGATTDTAFVMWLTPNKKGFITFANKNYPEDQIEIYIDYDYTKATLVSADNLDVTNANPTQEANIINNNDKYTVTVEENTITITDKGMLSYVGGNSSDPKKWFGYLLDFGVDVDCVSGYNIEDIDRTAARRWGATTDTAFVVWMTPEKAGSYTFRNKYYSEDTITVSVVFEDYLAELKSARPISVENADSSETDIVNNYGKYDVTYDNNKITIVDRGIISYVGGDQGEAQKWVGVLIDLNVKVNGTGIYGIEANDYTDAARWGATNDTTFIAWLRPTKTGIFEFTNALNPDDVINIEVEFVEPKTKLKSARPISVDNANSSETDIVNNYGKYDVTYENNKITIEDKGIIPYVGGDQGEAQKWVGVLIDLNTKVAGTGIYGIENADYEQAIRWGATNDRTFIAWLRPTKTGTFEFTNVSDPTDVINIDVEFVQHKIEFLGATNIDTSLTTSSDNPGIKANANTYDVSYDENNKITITEKDMIPYIGGWNNTTPMNWVGFLVDFGVEVEGDPQKYLIMPEDKSDAQRFGATTDTAFIMWLNTTEGGSYEFHNKEYPDDKCTIEVEFVRNNIGLVSATSIDGTQATNQDNPGIELNNGRYTVTYNDNTININDVSMIPYVGGNRVDPDKWIGVLVDLGVKVESTGTYTINAEDYTEARRWGATNNTTFIMWLTPDKSGTYTFRNLSYPDETTSIEIEITHEQLDIEGVNKINTSNSTISEDIKNNNDKYSVELNNSTVTITDSGLVPYEYKDELNKWVGVLVDFGTKVTCTNGYEITDDSYTEALLYGAETDTTFIMWLNVEDGKTYTFKNSFYEDDTIDLTFEFVEQEVDCSLNPYDDRCPDLDAPLENQIHLGENEQLITSLFDVEVDIENNTFSVKLKDGVEYIPGNYAVYVWPTDNREGVKTQTFKLLDNYYYFDMDDVAELKEGTGDILNDNTWSVELTNVENIDLSLITLDSVYVSNNEENNLINYFSIIARRVDENTGRTYLDIKQLSEYDGESITGGNYVLNFSYSNTAYSNVLGTLERYTTLTIAVPTNAIIDVSSTSRRYTSSPVYYEVMNYKPDQNKITIKVGAEEPITLDVDDFNETYSGIDLGGITTDENGNILYRYNDDILVKKVVTEDNVEIVYYYDENDNLQSLSYTEFVGTYGELDRNNYNYEDDHIYIKVNGQQLEKQNYNRTIRYDDNGVFTFVAKYPSNLSSSNANLKNVTLKHVRNDQYENSNEEFYVYSKKRRNGNIVNGTHSIDSDGAQAVVMSLPVVDKVNKTITFTITYDSKKMRDSGKDTTRYMGAWVIEFENVKGLQYEKSFTIEDAPIDFYLASSVDKHTESIEPLQTNFPPGNKNYEYYLSLRMVKGSIDPVPQYNADNIQVKIYKKRANLDEDKHIYFYDQQDYNLRIKNYKNNVVTYDLTFDVDKAENERTYETKTETIDGNSKFETKYIDAYKLLNKYVYDENGNIDVSQDNYTKSIIKHYRDGNMDYVVYRENGQEYTVQANEYATDDNSIATLTTAYRYLEYDEDNGVVVGSILGSYEDNITTDEDVNDVTNLFDITVNQDTTDINHAIKILPKTEVDGGVYYTYVEYNSALYGVGYVNDAAENEVVIRPERYPSLWNRNIHMSTITYLDPVYELSILDSEKTNTLNGEEDLYVNIESKLIYYVKAKDIFNYGDIVHKLQYKNGEVYDDVLNTNYSYILATKNSNNEYEEIEDFANYKGNYYVVITTSDNLDPAKYRFVLAYTNPNNNVSATTQYDVFDIDKKYYGLLLNDDSDELVVPHNNSVEKTIILDGESIDNPDDIDIGIQYRLNGNGYPLTKNNDGSYSYTVNGVTNVYFNTSKSHVVDENDSSKIKYTFKITNVSDVTQIGDYTISFRYQEGTSDPYVLPVTYTIGGDQYITELKNTYPKVESNEMTFAMDLTTKYIPSNYVNSNNITVKLLHFKNNNFVDVSSNTVANEDKEVSRIEFENIECENDICTGKVVFYLNNNINYEDLYNVQISYNGVDENVAIDAFEDMFAWNLETQSVTSLYAHEEDGVLVQETVEGIYKNLTNQRIEIKIDTDIYKDNVQWVINDKCVSGSGETCTPTDLYSDMFSAVNTTGANQIITLTPKKMNGNIIIPNGRHALVLYYSNNNYKVVEFEVRSEYISITIDPSGDYGDASIKSTLNGNELDGFYTNLNGVLTLPTSITGIDYNRVNRYVTDAMGQRVNAFDINDIYDFADTHTTKVFKNANAVPAGNYIVVTEYIPQDGSPLVFQYAFEVQDHYFDFSILDSIQVYPDNGRPKYLYNNKSGKIVYTIEAKNLNYLEKDQYNNPNSGRMYTFKDNSKMYDANGNDVSNYFTFNVKAHDDIFISNKFDIEVSFTGNTVPVGSYKFTTFYNYPGTNRTITKEADWVMIDESDKDFHIDGVVVTSETEDNLVHTSHGGSYTINYTSNVDNVQDVINVKVMLGEEDKTSNFTVTKNSNNITIAVPANSNLTPGNYEVVIDFDGDDFEVPIALYGAFNPNVALSSDVFEIADEIIYLKDLNRNNFTLVSNSYVFNTSYLINNLHNLKQGYRILDKNGNDVTNTNYTLGTGYKIVNPDDTTYTIVLYGDTNQDGKISIADVSKLFQYFTGKTRIVDPYVIEACKVRRKGTITIADVSKLYQFVTGKQFNL